MSYESTVDKLIPSTAQTAARQLRMPQNDKYLADHTAQDGSCECHGRTNIFHHKGLSVAGVDLRNGLVLFSTQAAAALCHLCLYAAISLIRCSCIVLFSEFCRKIKLSMISLVSVLPKVLFREVCKRHFQSSKNISLNKKRMQNNSYFQ